MARKHVPYKPYARSLTLKHLLLIITGFKLLFAVLYKVSMQTQAEVGFVERNRLNSLQHAYHIGHHSA
jgi:hypothetical protein